MRTVSPYIHGSGCYVKPSWAQPSYIYLILITSFVEVIIICICFIIQCVAHPHPHAPPLPEAPNFATVAAQTTLPFPPPPLLLIPPMLLPGLCPARRSNREPGKIGLTQRPPSSFRSMFSNLKITLTPRAYRVSNTDASAHRLRCRIHC